MIYMVLKYPVANFYFHRIYVYFLIITAFGQLKPFLHESPPPKNKQLTGIVLSYTYINIKIFVTLVVNSVCFMYCINI